MMCPEVLFLGWFDFPEGSPGAHYVHGLGKALRAGGHTVGYVTQWGAGRERDRRADGSYWFDGFAYYPVGFRSRRRLLRRLFPTVRGPLDATLAWLESQDLRWVRHIFTYSGSCAYLMKLRAFCARRKITLSNLVVEWYSPWGYSPRDPLSWTSQLLDTEIQRRLVNRLIGNVVCISTYLHEYYSRRGCSSVNIPHLLDLDEDKWPKSIAPREENHGLNLVFAGVGGTKDLVHNAIRGLALLGSQGKDTKISICGPRREEVAAWLGRRRHILDDLAGQLDFRGRLSHRQALAEVAQADFSIMLRLDARFTRAGFPTKLGESLGCGVPLLGNLTGDVGRYVTDGVEGILVPDCAPQSFARGLTRGLSLSATARHTMRIRARQRAEASLNYRKYVQTMHEFLERLSWRTKRSDS